MEEEPKTTITTKSVQDGYPAPPTITTVLILAVIVMLGLPVLLIVGHALPVLDDFFAGLRPLAIWLGRATGVALIILLFRGIWYLHNLFRVDIKRRNIEARRFNPNEHGILPAYFDTREMFVIPKSTVVKPVPTHYAPEIHISGASNVKEIEASAPKLDFNIAKPQVSELAAKIERNSLQVCLGRSLTNGEYLIADLEGKHIKIIGASQTGKSCQAVAIHEQLQQTHDPDKLRFAILDREYKPSRLLEHSEHVAVVSGRPCIARNIDEVPIYLGYLVDELERRDRLSYQELVLLPRILIYIEEFLDLKKRLKLADRKICNKFLVDFNTLATRGLKLGLHLMICAQVDYADDDLKDAMAQFNGIYMSFSVIPTAARAAGFTSTELLNQNFASKTPGQFVLEMAGCCDLAVAPDYDVKAKLEALGQAQIVTVKQARNTSDSALQAKLAQIMEIPGESMRDCIKRVWGASPGDNEGWRRAKSEYEQCMMQLYALALVGMERED